MGIRKAGEYAIQITTVAEHTGPNDIKNHFNSRSSTPVNLTLWEASMSADGLTTSYGSDLAHYMGSGPCCFSERDYNSIHICEKNPDHWNADLYNYDRVEVRVIPEMNARVEMFEKGDIHSLTPDANTIDSYPDDPASC